MSPVDRRRFLACALGGWGASLVSSRAFAQGAPLSPEQSAAEFMTAEVEESVARGLAFLAAQQTDEGCFGVSGYSRNVAVVALAGMAFMAGGSTPGRGPYGAQINGCLDYLLAHTQADGFIVSRGAESRGPMYGHGFATLFLAEVYGMSPRTDVQEKLSRAVRLIVSTQNSEGGWRYQPQRADADISVTIAMVMALRAARNAGLNVPNETIDRCIDYVKRSQNPDGGFMYMLEAGGPSAFPRSAAGVVALYSAGIYEGEELRKGLEYLAPHAPRSDVFDHDGHFFYGHYYAVQAMWHAGGPRWREWYPAIRDALLPRQRDDGSWLDVFGAEYGTAMAAIILQMPNNYLPIFQR